MAIRQYKPTSAGTRHRTGPGFDELTGDQSVPSNLTWNTKKNGGRNHYGRITMRHRGGGARQQYREIDFRRDKIGVPAVVSDGVALARDIEEWGVGARCAGEPHEFQTALDALLSDAGRRAALGRRALEMAGQFRPTPVCEGLERLYEAARAGSVPAASGTALSSCIPESGA